MSVEKKENLGSILDKMNALLDKMLDIVKNNKPELDNEAPNE